MIISASYKTDIPTFYGEWFKNRLDAGYCRMLNPYNRQPIYVSLSRSDVDGFIFWTKNIGPFLDILKIVHQRGYPFIVQHTINGYPKCLEYSVVDVEKSIANVARLAETYGQRTCVWRYDTIVISSETPVEFHLLQFEKLAKKMCNYVDEVVISFVHLYAKTLRNMKWAESEFRFEWNDIDLESKRKLVRQLVQIANAHNLKLSICSQREYLVDGAHDAKCVDAERMQQLAGKAFSAELKGNRTECGCYASRDIGEYDTCPHGCVYCYAVKNRELAQRNFKCHDPNSEFLFAPTTTDKNLSANKTLFD
jgi:hypothetical protein